MEKHKWVSARTRACAPAPGRSTVVEILLANTTKKASARANERHANDEAARGRGVSVSTSRQTNAARRRAQLQRAQATSAGHERVQTSACKRAHACRRAQLQHSGQTNAGVVRDRHYDTVGAACAHGWRGDPRYRHCARCGSSLPHQPVGSTFGDRNKQSHPGREMHGDSAYSVYFIGLISSSDATDTIRLDLLIRPCAAC